MTGGSGAKDAPHTFTDEELAQIGENLPELRPYVSEPRILHWSLGIGFMVDLFTNAWTVEASTLRSPSEPATW